MKKMLFYFLVYGAISFSMMSLVVQLSADQIKASFDAGYDDVYDAYVTHMQDHATTFRPRPLTWWQIVGVKVGVPFYKRCIAPVKNRVTLWWRIAVGKVRRNHANR